MDTKVASVKNNFALIVTDDYNKANWTFTAFDKNGNLVADKLFGAEQRMVNTIKNEEETVLERLAMDYILAEYNGDSVTLQNLTDGKAGKAVENGELEIFQGHLLDQIVDIKIVELKQGNAKIIVTVSSKISDSAFATNYFENIYFEIVNQDWKIVDVERDQ